MSTNPIIPIGIMLIICLIFIILSFKSKNIGRITLRILIAVLFFVTNLRITKTSGGESISYKSNLNVIFAIDSTISMSALDYNGSNERKTGVDNDCLYIISKLSGSSFAVMTFDNEGKIRFPITNDSNAIINFIKSYQLVDSYYAEGSNLNVSLETLEQLVEKSNKKNNTKTIVYYISDGEITNDKSLTSFAKLKGKIDGGAVLGYGTTSGGKMVKTTMNERVYYYTDPDTYLEATSKIDETNLKKIANDMGIEYIHMTSQSKIESNVNNVLKMASLIETKKDNSTKVEYYYYFAIALLTLLLVELFVWKKNVL